MRVYSIANFTEFNGIYCQINHCNPTRDFAFSPGSEVQRHILFKVLALEKHQVRTIVRAKLHDPCAIGGVILARGLFLFAFRGPIAEIKFICKLSELYALLPKSIALKNPG